MPTDAFNNFAKHCAAIVGSPWAFVLAVVVVITWVVTGPQFAYSDAWQLAINTGTSIATFLMGIAWLSLASLEPHQVDLLSETG